VEVVYEKSRDNILDYLLWGLLQIIIMLAVFSHGLFELFLRKIRNQIFKTFPSDSAPSFPDSFSPIFSDVFVKLDVTIENKLCLPYLSVCT